MFQLALRYPEAKTIYLVLDNLNIHRRKALTDLLGEEVSTTRRSMEAGSIRPKSKIGMLSRQCLSKRRIPDSKTLRREARAWNRRMNRHRTTIHWKFDRKAARRKFGYQWKGK